jgi:excisionase family DNA binding protein
VNSPLLNPEQVAELLGVSVRYVWRLGRDGELPRIKVGKYVRFDPVEVDTFIEQRRSGPRARRAHVESPRERIGATSRTTVPRRRF